jgi:hypothetical protein
MELFILIDVRKTVNVIDDCKAVNAIDDCKAVNAIRSLKFSAGWPQNVGGFAIGLVRDR